MSRPTNAALIVSWGLIAAACTGTPQPTEEVPQTLSIESSAQTWPTIDPYQTLRFDRYSVTEGLSQSSAISMLQDSRGYLWIGTEDGLNRFDGVEFKIYRADPDDPQSLSNNFVTALAEDAAGDLWIGTYGGGLNRFDPNTEAFTHYLSGPEDRSSLSNDQVFELFIDSSEIIWIGYRGGGLDRFDPANETFDNFRHEPDNSNSLSQDDVRAIAEDDLGMLWIGTSTGLNRLDPVSLEFTFYLHDPSHPDTPSADPILELFVDRGGDLWIGTVRGLDKYSQTRNRVDHYLYDDADPFGLSNPIVSAIGEDPEGGLWVGTDSGLNYLDRASGNFIHFQNNPANPHSLSRNEIDSLLFDASGGLWVGTYGGGLNRTDPRRAQLALYQAQVDEPNGLADSAVWGIYEDKSGVLWIGTDGGGLDRFDRRTGEWRHFRSNVNDPTSLNSDVIMGVNEDHLGVLWVSTAGGGLSRLDHPSGEFETFRNDPEDPSSLSHDTVWFAKEDNKGELWVGTAWGLNHFDRKTGRFTRYLHDPDNPFSLADNNVGSFFADSSGAIWVGTHEGLHRFEPTSGQFQRFLHDPENPNSLSHNIVFAVHEDESGTLWFGTWGGGLNRYDPATDSFVHYRVRDGLPNDVIYGIMEDGEGHLWLTTNNGLSRFNPETESFLNFDQADGLQSNEFSYNGYFQSPTGEMFVAGIDGFNVFTPADLAPNSYYPPIVLTSLSNDGQPIDISKEIVLNWPVNGFEFEYAALNYSQPHKSQYAYRLQGFEESWNDVGTQRFGRYTNLPGGDYTLQIRGTNQDGVWNEAAATISIQVTPPFWSSLWFMGLALVVVGIVAYSAFRLRINAVEKRSHELEEQIRQRTSALEERSEELERRGRELEALYQADEKLLSRLDLDEVLQALVDTAIEILAADKGGVAVWDDRSEELVIRASRGFAPGAFEEVSFVPGRGVIGLVFESGEPIAVEDTSQEPRATKKLIEAEGIGAFIQVPIKIGDEVYGVFSADYLEPQVFDQATIQLLISLASHAALAIDSARLYESTTSQVAQLSALQDTTRALASTLEIEALLSLIIQQATSLLNADGGMINLVRDEEAVDEVVAATGLVADTIGMGSRLDSSLSGWVTLNNEPVIVNDVRQDERVTRDEPELVHLIQATAMAPLAIKNDVIGTLVVVGTEQGKGDFDQAELETLVAFANQAAIAIDNARLYSHAGQIAALEERARLARDLHDAVTQTLFSASLIAEALPTVWREDPAEGDDLLQELRQLNRGALAEMRSLLMELRPAALEEAELPDLMRQLGAAIIGRSGIEVQVETQGECEAPTDVHVTLYRIAQEALNNIIKHANASHVQVSLMCTKSDDSQNGAGTRALELRVQDDGQGFDSDQKMADGLGLRIMRERVESIGANLEITSEPGEGTTLQVLWEG